MAAPPPITGIRLIEVPAPSGNSAFGHLAWDISLQGGENLILEAGPSGPNGTGNLVEQDYGTTATSSNSITLPGTFNLQAIGDGLLDGASNYNTAGPVAYGALGENSNTYAYAIGQSAGLSNSTLNSLIQELGNQTGLSAPGASSSDALQSGIDNKVGGDAPVLVSGTPGDGNPDPGSGGGTPVRIG